MEKLAMSIIIKVESNKTKMNDVSIQDMNVLLDGGVYMFVLDGLPIYVGETNIFLTRISEHLKALESKPSYFGFGQLTGEHKLDYYLLENSLPYVETLRFGNKRKSDKNAPERRRLEGEYIKNYHPIVQNPINKGKYQRSRKKDGMIVGDDAIKDELVKNYLDVSTGYTLIKK